MEKIWIFLNLCVLCFFQLNVAGRPEPDLVNDHGSIKENETESLNLTTSNNKINEIQLFPIVSKFPGQTRHPRKFFSKLHSGAAFLTGFKLGNLLAKKGFELGSGQIASTHNFQLFGKNVNSAMSLSYGNSESFLPELNNLENNEEKQKIKNNDVKKDVFLVTVIENSSFETPTKLEETIKEKNTGETSGNDDNSEEIQTRSGIITLYQEVEKEKEADKSFLKEHNDLVKKVNEKLMKRNNSKFR